MPALALAPIARSVQIPTRARLPRPEVVDPTARVAILDGGLPKDHSLAPWIETYREMNEGVANSAAYEAHGLAVASAFLFGPMRAGIQPPLPPAKHEQLCADCCISGR